MKECAGAVNIHPDISVFTTMTFQTFRCSRIKGRIMLSYLLNNKYNASVHVLKCTRRFWEGYDFRCQFNSLPDRPFQTEMLRLKKT